MNKEIQKDISVIGAGVTGLMLTNKLTNMGYSVALIDKHPSVASGPSTKNEGWLHRGTYHATSIKEPQQAAQVARRCIYGYDQIRKYAPEAIEDADRPTYAVALDEETSNRSTERWESTGVRYRPISRKEFINTNPDVNPSEIAAAYEVADVSINSRLLYHKLLTQSKKAGAEILLGTNFRPIDDENAHLQNVRGDNANLRSDNFIVTAGTGISDIYKQVTGTDLPIRFWKSHLLVLPRLTDNNVFSLNPGEAALFNHGETSVIGQHEDAIAIREPDYSVDSDSERCVFEATKRLFTNATKHTETYMPIACIKPDVITSPGQSRSLDITVFEPSDSYTFALPGKMTEAPFVVDQLVQTLFNKQANNAVAFRPCDTYTQSSNLEFIP